LIAFLLKVNAMTRNTTPLWVKWILGVFATLMTAGVVGGSATLAGHGEELAESHIRVDALKEGQQRIEMKQDRLDKKLDKVIEHLMTR
jgi:hypothetical protein